MKSPDGVGSGLVTALESAYDALRERHPDLPRVVFITGRGIVGKPQGWRWGHYSRNSWMLVRRKQAPEIFIAGELFKLGAVPTFETIAHEAVHALAVAREIKDTSRGHRYHNKRYLNLAVELGLRYAGRTPDPMVGFSEVVLRPETKAAYADTIRELRLALIAHIPAEVSIPEPPADRNYVKAVCACGRRIRASRRVLAEGPITCGLCGRTFTAVVDAR
jgi:hypothetical protein